MLLTCLYSLSIVVYPLVKFLNILLQNNFQASQYNSFHLEFLKMADAHRSYADGRHPALPALLEQRPHLDSGIFSIYNSWICIFMSVNALSYKLSSVEEQNRVSVANLAILLYVCFWVSCFRSYVMSESLSFNWSTSTFKMFILCMHIYRSVYSSMYMCMQIHKFTSIHQWRNKLEFDY